MNGGACVSLDCVRLYGGLLWLSHWPRVQNSVFESRFGIAAVPLWGRRIGDLDFRVVWPMMNCLRHRTSRSFLGIIFILIVPQSVALEDDLDADGIASGHHAGIVDGGYDALVLRLHLIRHAASRIELQSFIWIDDEAGHALMNECVRAAERGVRVRVLLDHMYSEQDRSVMASLARAHPNFELRLYRPPWRRLASGRVRNLAHSARHPYAKNQRMHNKAIVIDGETCLISGRNFSNHYFGMGDDRNYIDRGVLLTGPLVSDVADSFDAYWESEFSVPVGELVDVAPLMGEVTPWRVEDVATYADRIVGAVRDADDGTYVDQAFGAKLLPVKRAWLAIDPPGKKRKNDWPYPNTTDALLDVVGAAESSVVLQSTYLILNRRTRAFFEALVRQHPSLAITVSTNSYASTGNMMHYAGTFRSRAAALGLGMKVYELKPDAGADENISNGESTSAGFISMHAKSLVVDDHVACIGSSNLAPRSFTLNTEIALFVDDAAFAGQLRESIERDMLPENSWDAGMRSFRGARFNRIVEKGSRWLPLDVWPVSSTASFEGDHSAGVLPGAKRGTLKHIKFTVYKILGPLIRPLL